MWPAPWRPTTTSGAGARRRSSTSSRASRTAPRRSSACARRPTPSPGEILVGGLDPGTADFNDAVYGNFIYVALVIIAITFLLLARVFRSLLLPLKAILFNIISIGRGLGLHGLVLAEGQWLRVDLRHPADRRADGVDTADGLRVPLRALDGLRDLHPQPHARGVRPRRLDRARGGGGDRSHRTPGDGGLADPVPGLPRPRGQPGTDIKVFATGLAVGILLDATVVRSMLLPAFVAVLGRWNWWMPAGPAGSCASSPATPLPSIAATRRWSWSRRPGRRVRPSPRAGRRGRRPPPSPYSGDGGGRWVGEGTARGSGGVTVLPGLSLAVAEEQRDRTARPERVREEHADAGDRGHPTPAGDVPARRTATHRAGALHGHVHRRLHRHAARALDGQRSSGSELPGGAAARSRDAAGGGRRR